MMPIHHNVLLNIIEKARIFASLTYEIKKFNKYYKKLSFTFSKSLFMKYLILTEQSCNN